MKVLICEFGGLGEEFIEKFFQKRDYQVSVIKNPTKNFDYDQNFFEKFLEKIKQELPDIVFSFNFMPIVSKVCQIYGIIYICWVYDCPEMHLYSEAITNSVNRIFLFDRVQYQRFYEMSPNTIFHMPLATNPLSLKDMKSISINDHKEYDNEICFMGSLYTEATRKYYDIKQLPEYWQGYIQGIVEAQLNVFGYNFIADSLSDEQVQELKSYLKFELVDDYTASDREIIADQYIGWMCSALDRKRTIQHIAKEHQVALYTVSDTKDYYNIDNRGVADSLTMMPKIFHCSKINLNITSKTIQSGISLRVLDVLGCKGFLITNYQPEIVEYFEDGKDLVVYEDLDDLTDKINYYLEHEDERKQIAENGYQKVCEYFTYDKVLDEILTLAGV